MKLYSSNDSTHKNKNKELTDKMLKESETLAEIDNSQHISTTKE